MKGAIFLKIHFLVNPFLSFHLARLIADAPAANQLYGGRINQARRIEIGTITQVLL